MAGCNLEQSMPAEASSRSCDESMIALDRTCSLAQAPLSTRFSLAERKKRRLPNADVAEARSDRSACSLNIRPFTDLNEGMTISSYTAKVREIPGRSLANRISTPSEECCHFYIYYSSGES
jgi:hypothetical protein